jgi:hypothetical protein
VMFALPAVLEPRKPTNPLMLLVIVALPAVLVSLKLANPLPLLVMVALPAVLELRNVVTAFVPLFVMIALPAVLLFMNIKLLRTGSEKLGAFEDMLTMPAPVIEKLPEGGSVKE